MLVQTTDIAFNSVLFLHQNFLECWEECVPGNLAGLTLYLPEIIQLAFGLLDHDDWLYKRTALRTLKQVLYCCCTYIYISCI